MSDLRGALDELATAIEDAQRRFEGGDMLALRSNMLAATLRQARESLDVFDRVKFAAGGEFTPEGESLLPAVPNEEASTFTYFLPDGLLIVPQGAVLTAFMKAREMIEAFEREPLTEEARAFLRSPVVEALVKQAFPERQG